MNASLNGRDFEFTRGDFQRICALIREHAGISLAESKYEMVYTRLARRLRVLNLDKFSDYINRLENRDPAEWEFFTNALTTNLTSFFREPHHFPILASLLKSLKRNRPYRIWCAAASTGEEPWSIAITACETFNSLTPPVSILASDIDTHVLETAKQAIYEMDRVDNLGAGRLQQFFLRGTGANAGRVKLRPELQALVKFRQLNLLHNDWKDIGRFDAIFCRNVMIYFDKPTQYQVLTNLMPLLEPDGLLFAGHSESFFHASDLLELREHTVYAHAQSNLTPTVGPRGRHT